MRGMAAEITAACATHTMLDSRSVVTSYDKFMITLLITNVDTVNKNVTKKLPKPFVRF